MMSRPGDSIGGCIILESCGRGAYGQVFLAENALGQRVAVKKMLTEEAGDYELKGLRNYISISSDAPGLLRVFHCGMDEGLPFYVMEAADNASDDADKYVPDTLSRRLERMGRLPAQEALDICHSILNGLEAMHNAGLLHRDVKPENVIFVNDQPKLGDPGLTRSFEQTISVAGTPGYIAPEFYKGEGNAAPTTDIYALGKMLYHIVTGKPPSEFPEMPDDMPVEELYQICRPLLKLCEPSPQKRCQSGAEARKLLPTAFVHHNAVLRFRDALVVRPSFRRRVMRCVAVGMLAALLVVCSVLGFFRWRRFEEAACAERMAGLQAEMDDMERLRPRLELQFKGALPSSIDSRLKRVQDELKEGRLSQAAESINGINSDLMSEALSRLPEITMNSNFNECAYGFGYLSSPLGLLLPKKERDDYAGRLSALATKLSGGGERTIRLGQNRTETRLYPFTLVFVSPGRFVSPYLKAEREISYPFWIFDVELTSAQYVEYTGILSKHNSPECAAEYLCWNDALLLCHDLNERASLHCAFPAGYGIRIPTEEEWEFAAVGGWDGKLPSPRKIPAGSKCSAPSMENANALGICGMDDNLSELCLAYPDAASPHVHGVARGSSYIWKETGISKRFHYLLDQTHAKGSSGLRPVLAPIDDGYWKREWYRGPSIESTVIDGKVYAGWSHCRVATSWRDAVQLADSMGAALPESCNVNAIKNIYKQLRLVPSFPCFLGIRSNDGKWVKASDGNPAEVPKAVAHNPQNPCVGIGEGGPFLMKEETAMPTVIFRWKDEAAYARRLESWLTNAKVASFNVGERRFAVCKTVLIAYAVRPFVEFLGARQPVFASAEELNAVVEKLPQGVGRIALGPISFYHEWEQPDGSILPSGIAIDDSELSRATIFSHTLEILTASKGKVQQSLAANYILVDLTKK